VLGDAPGRPEWAPFGSLLDKLVITIKECLILWTWADLSPEDDDPDLPLEPDRQEPADPS
jgi:hypothetical protein